MLRRDFLLTLGIGAPLYAARNASPWNLRDLMDPPRQYEASGIREEGVRGLFFEGLPWRGKPTKVFAWYGAAPQAERPSPAMVLVHGGGGTAFAEWVRMWNRRGYAAIAMDTCGDVPLPGTAHSLSNPHQRHPDGGPPGWGGFDQIDQPVEDQWTYHAAGAAIRAHSLLRSLPGVDARRIGLTGISWGGYLVSIVGSLDHRFRFAAPVYGCGFADGPESAWLGTLQKMGEARSRRWLELWDASRYLKLAKIPFLWVSGTDDRFFPLPSLQKSYRLPRAAHTLAIRVGMKHSHPDGARPEEIAAFADARLRSGKPLARITGSGLRNGEAWVKWERKADVASVVLEYTRDSGRWENRKWERVAAQMDPQDGEVHSVIPAGATALYYNLTNAAGLVVSSEHVTL